MKTADPVARAAWRRALVADPAGAVQAAFAIAGALAADGEAGRAYPLAWWTAQCAADTPGVLVQLGAIASAAGRHRTAEAVFAKAAHLVPDNHAIALSAAWAAWRNNERAAARGFARRAYLLSGGEPQAMTLLAETADGEAATPSVLDWAARSCVTDPFAAASWCRRAEVYRNQGDPAGGLRDAMRAVLLAPGDRLSCRALASNALLRARFGIARRVAGTALLDHPGDHELCYLLAQAEKAGGDLGRGWDLEAARDKGGRFHDVRNLPPRAIGGAGGDLPDRGLLIAGEQGLGDELLYLSCLPDLLTECRSPVLEADSRLHPLLARSFPDLRLIPRQLRAVDGRPTADYAGIVQRMGLSASLFIGDLAARYRRERRFAPSRAGYLTVDPDRRRYWAERVSAIRGEAERIVGVAWSSGSKSATRVLYNASLDSMLEMFRIPGIRFVCLQYTDCREELAAFRARHGVDIWRPDELDQRADLDGTAALMSTLDTVVAADTSPCLLAAAIGCPTLRLAGGVFRVLDRQDLFFANMMPMIARSEAVSLPLAVSRAADVLRGGVP